MKIVVLDTLPLDAGDVDWTDLRAIGDLALYTGTPPDEVAARIADADIVITNKVPVRAASLATAAHLRVISVLATGYDVVDFREARERGIPVCNIPGYSNAFTAQTAIALMLELANRAGLHAEIGTARRLERVPDVRLLENAPGRVGRQNASHRRTWDHRPARSDRM